ncbi:MAG: hypothetical protein L0287_10705 [Anaerolineae bacterium]|nr:hypothetical protein [Anaerolineae bacterium]
MNTKSPRVVIILVSLLALFQVIRVAAYSMVTDIQAGITPVEWMFPALMDIFVGVTAPFIAIGLWRGKGLAVWTSGIVFFVLSISDHLDAMTVVLTTKGPLPAMMSGAPSSTATFLAVMSLIEAFAIWALAGKSMRNHYLPSQMDS